MKSYVAVSAVIAGCAGTLAANAITMQTPFAFRSDRTANSLGLLQSSIVIGVNGVLPNSLDGTPEGLLTTVTATQDGTTISLGKINAAVGTPFRNSYIAQVAYDADLTGAWAVTATNTATTPESLTLSTVAFGPVASVPFVASMSLSGAGTDLNLNWVQPATNDRIDRQTIFVYEQQASGAYQLVFSQELGTTARAFNLGAIALSAGVDIGTNYVISIDTSDNVSGGTVASSASYFNFTPTPAPVEVYLPSSGAPGVSEYNVRVVNGEPVSLVTQGGALGYDFVSTAGGPLFQSIELPTSGGGSFDLWLFDDEGEAVFAQQIGDSVYNFGSDGVSAFRLFAPGLGSGPTSSTEFSFTPMLTFADRGTFTGSISALTADPRPPTSVPEPTTLTLLGGGLVLLALRRRKQRN